MSRYAATHANPQGPGDARPTALQIVRDEAMEDGLKGKVIVITGVSSGLGIETVRALSITGAMLFLTARNPDVARAALADFFEPERMELVEMDQESLISVRSAARTILSKTDKVNVLVNNAGVMAVPELRHTEDGFELQFCVNYLSHFLFFQLLKPALLAASTLKFQSRVVVVSSTAHRVHGINDSDNYNYEKGGYNPWAAYGQSKTATIYMANHIERRYGSQGLHATSLHPGGINTGISRHMSHEELEGYSRDGDLWKTMKSPEQGAATTVWAAIGRECEGKGGIYLVDCAQAERGPDNGDFRSQTYCSHTYDAEAEGRLWRDSLELVGLDDDN